MLRQMILVFLLHLSSPSYAVTASREASTIWHHEDRKMPEPQSRRRMAASFECMDQDEFAKYCQRQLTHRNVTLDGTSSQLEYAAFLNDLPCLFDEDACQEAPRATDDAGTTTTNDEFNALTLPLRLKYIAAVCKHQATTEMGGDEDSINEQRCMDGLLKNHNLTESSSEFGFLTFMTDFKSEMYDFCYSVYSAVASNDLIVPCGMLPPTASPTEAMVATNQRDVVFLQGGDEGKKGLSPGAWVGIVLACLFFLLLLLFCFLWPRRRKSGEKAEQEVAAADAETTGQGAGSQSVEPLKGPSNEAGGGGSSNMISRTFDEDSDACSDGSEHDVENAVPGPATQPPQESTEVQSPPVESSS